MYIINIGDIWIKKGMFPTFKSILIQITSPDAIHSLPQSLDNFCKIYRFKFDDIDLKNLKIIENFKKNNQLIENIKPISNIQAKNIAEALIDAHKKDLNVIVNCQAGISRSGAVAQVAIDCLGFKEAPDISCLRHPNTLVYQKIKYYLDKKLRRSENL